MIPVVRCACVGEVLSAGVSAKKRIGLDELLEKILLQVRLATLTCSYCI